MPTTPRTAPTGAAMQDGYKTVIAFAADPDILLWEESVQPPGVDGGEKMSMTTMFNDEWHTFAAQALKMLTDSAITCKYVPAAYPLIVALVNINGWITIHFPNLGTLDFVGYLQSAIPNSHEIGTPPTIALKINPTNRLNTGVETDPVYTPPA